MKTKRFLIVGIGLVSWFMAAAAPPHPQTLAKLAVIGTQAQPGQQTTAKSPLSIIPLPEKVKRRHGVFDTAEKPEILFEVQDQQVTALAAYLAETWREATGSAPDISGEKSAGDSTSIRLALNRSLKHLGDEGYRLKIEPRAIEISAPKPAGLFYGIQSLRQLATGARTIPCAEIEDRPRFGWRGMLLDCCRHFMTVDLVKRYIDLLAYHKMNVFHWHLTEDQGWRLEIKRYPRLTEIGAWRTQNGKRCGGFYTQDEVRDVVAYAASRFVTIVPEIEMPGHSVAALAAYPELSCTGVPIAVENHWGIFNDVMCPGKDSTFEFVQNVLDEVIALFPSTYIHIGGDECPKYYWKTCPFCQARIKAEGLKDENELQGYFTRRVEKYVLSKGRRIIGWDEILEGGVSATAVVQSWRGMAGALAAAKQGNAVISSPIDTTYFNCPQAPEEARLGYPWVNTLEEAHSFDPVPPGLTPRQASLIMGGECCLWSEYIQEFELDSLVFPRLCAFAESVWSPAKASTFADFSARLDGHLPRLAALGVDYHRPEARVGGWKDGETSRLWQELWWDVTPQVTKDGIYRVNFVQNKGEDGVSIDWVALFEDNREVSRWNELNRSLTDAFLIYPLRLAQFKPGAKYTIRASIVSGKDRAKSAGSLWLRYFKYNDINLW
jgi:hexosaminidase